MRRSIGLLLTQIALAGIAFLQLCCALGTLLAAFGVRQQQTQAGIPPGGTLVVAVSILFTLVFAALAAWSILTIVGLGRRRSWARYSVLVQGGLLAAFGTVSAAGFLVLRTVAPTMPPPPGQTPQSMAMVSSLFIGIAVFYALTAALGVALLVFFNLRTTKALFEPVLPLDPSYPPPPPPLPGRFDHIPTPIFVLVFLYGLSTITTAIAAFLPLPAFLMGFILTGASMHILYAALAIISGGIGWGLYQLDNRARIAAFVQAAFAIVNIALSMLPYYQGRLREYSARLNEAMNIPPTVTPNPATTYPVTLLMSGFAIVVVAVFVWILVRYRAAFTRTAQPPTAAL